MDSSAETNRTSAQSVCDLKDGVLTAIVFQKFSNLE